MIVDSGDPGGEPGEFAEALRQFLAEWFDGAGVVELKEGQSHPADAVI